MRVPIIYADKPLEVVHTPNVGVGEMAEAQVGGEVVELSGLIAQRQAVLQERERRAQEEIQAVKADTEMNKRVDKEAEYFLTNPDYTTYDTRKTEFLKSLHDEFAPKEGSSKEAQLAFSRSFRNISSGFEDFVRTKKYKAMEDDSLSTIKDLVIQKGKKYATLTDPRDKEILIKSTEMDIRRLMDAGTVNKLVGENEIRGIEKTFQAIDIDVAKGSAIARMSTEPDKLAVDLKDPSYLPEWTDKSERAMMANQAETAARIKKDQVRIEADRAKTLAAEAEDKKIAKLYNSRDYTAAYTAVSNSKFISGSDVRVWTNAIDQAVKGGAVDKTKQMEAISSIKEDMNSGRDPAEIKRKIMLEPNMDPQNKEQYYNMVDEKIAVEVREGKSQAYSYMKSQISPYSAMIPAGPVQSQAYYNAQEALDTWVKDFQKTGKSPSGSEIFNKAKELSVEFKPKVKDIIQQQRQEMTQVLGAMKKGKQVPIDERSKKLMKEGKSNEEIEKTLKAEYTQMELDEWMANR